MILVEDEIQESSSTTAMSNGQGRERVHRKPYPLFPFKVLIFSTIANTKHSHFYSLGELLFKFVHWDL